MTRRAWRKVDGVLLLDKPSGLSSNAALQRARRALQAEKGGHTGTLDPLASGLLPLCFGEATKFAQFLLDADKSYRATVRFGIATDTHDAEGAVIATQPVALDRAQILALLAAATGPQLQVPPAHSALKFRGRPHYEYARAGEEVPREPRAVVISSLTLVEWRSPDAVIDVTCSKGTYVRVIAADLGVRAGCGAHLAALRRTRTGGFDLEGAVALDRLEAMPAPERCLLPVDTLVRHLPRTDLAAEMAAGFRHGQAVATASVHEGLHAVFAAGQLLGVAVVEGGKAHPRRTLAAAVSSAQPA